MSRPQLLGGWPLSAALSLPECCGAPVLYIEAHLSVPNLVPATLRVTAHGAWAAVATAIATVVSCSCRAAAHQKQGGGGLPTRWSSSSRSGRAHRDQGRDRSAAGAPHGICSLRMLLVRAREELHSSIGMAVLASSDGSAALPHPTSEYGTARTI